MKQKVGMRNTLIAIGLFLMAVSIALLRLNNIPDFIKGVLFGIGIGLLILAIWRK